MNKDLVSIIVVTYNSSKQIVDCLKSLEMQVEILYEIIIVDNNSNDDTLDKINESKVQIKLLPQKDNLGFAKANNLGVKESKGEYLVFLNPDALLTSPKSLHYLLELLVNNPQYGVLGPKLIYSDGHIQARVRNLPTVFRALQEYILGLRGSYCFYEPQCKSLCEVESVIGACVMIKKDLFKKAGGFDEKFFLYYEDLALCKTIRSLGYKVGFVPDITVIHTEGMSGKNQKTNKLMRTSARQYFGLLSFCLLELIFLYNRLLNRVRKIFGRPVYN